MNKELIIAIVGVVAVMLTAAYKFITGKDLTIFRRKKDGNESTGN